MPSRTIRPRWPAEDAAWIATYVAKHGGIPITVMGHDVTLSGDGAITVADRIETGMVQLLVSAPAEAVAAITDAAPEWVTAWCARGYV